MEISETALAKVGVRITVKEVLWLRCKRCNESWPLPESLNMGSSPFWRCPNGCNRNQGGIMRHYEMTGAICLCPRTSYSTLTADLPVPASLDFKSHAAL